jgi:hypothetical protein
MEKLSSHFMGHLANFPFNSYRTDIRREYMLLFTPILALAAHCRRNVYTNGSTAFFRLGLLSFAYPAAKTASFQAQRRPMLLKTSAYKWHGEHHARLPQKSRVAENTGFRSGGMSLSNQHFCNVRRILDTNTRTT